MKLKTFLIGLSIVANVLLGWQYLQSKVATVYYNAGVADQQLEFSNELVNQLNQTGRLQIGTPEGNIILIPQVNEQAAADSVE